MGFLGLMRLMGILRLMRNLDAVALQQSIDGRLAALEILVEGHWLVGAATREDAVAETLCRLLVEHAVPFEYCEGIGIQHLGPLVAIISCGVATAMICENCVVMQVSMRCGRMMAFFQAFFSKAMMSSSKASLFV